MLRRTVAIVMHIGSAPGSAKKRRDIIPMQLQDCCSMHMLFVKAAAAANNMEVLEEEEEEDVRRRRRA